jgi:hypothetical protein
MRKFHEHIYLNVYVTYITIDLNALIVNTNSIIVSCYLDFITPGGILSRMIINRRAHFIFLLLIALFLSALACKTLFPGSASSEIVPIQATESSSKGYPVAELTTSALPPQDKQATFTAAPFTAPASAAIVSLQEQPVTIIPLQGPVSRSEAEISGLAWYRDQLILLPQYPKRGGKGRDGSLWSIPKSDILAFLAGHLPGPLKPISIPLDAGGVDRQISGFEGFEAIAFMGNQIFLTIEAHGGASMRGYLIKGEISPDLSAIRLDPASLTENYLQANWGNSSDESILVASGEIFTFYELNGLELNPDPHATRFDPDLKLLGNIPFPRIEFRVTDATQLDDQERFWVINYFFPGDVAQSTEDDPLAKQYGRGPTHARSQIVERLVELQYSPQSIALTGTPPIQLQLRKDGEARNWEGIVRLDEMGFLLATDKFPETILGFVALP